MGNSFIKAGNLQVLLKNLDTVKCEYQSNQTIPRKIILLLQRAAARQGVLQGLDRWGLRWC